LSGCCPAEGLDAARRSADSTATFHHFVFYFAFGDTDAFVIAEAPDNISAAAVALAIGASGAVHAKTTVLLTPEEMDQATKKTVS
jgi:uncharacterized protein with GYD domain